MTREIAICRSVRSQRVIFQLLEDRIAELPPPSKMLATLRLIADGKANRGIASELGISARTVITATRRGLVRLN
jgi:DNA-binding NarL/FixJ family response regulator